MKHVKTLNSNTLKDSMKKGGCGECQTSCQSACKTSCTVVSVQDGRYSDAVLCIPGISDSFTMIQVS